MVPRGLYYKSRVLVRFLIRLGAKRVVVSFDCRMEMCSCRLRFLSIVIPRNSVSFTVVMVSELVAKCSFLLFVVKL